jgi:hypothetical protein
MRFGQMLDRVFQLLRGNVRTFVSIAAVPLAVMVVFYGLMIAALFTLIPGLATPHPPTPQPGAIAGIVGVVLLGMIPILMVYAMYEAALSYAALRLNAGLPVTSREAWRKAWEKMGRYLWLMALRTLVAMVPMLTIAAVLGVCVLVGAVALHGQPQPAVVAGLAVFGVLLYLAMLVVMVLIILWLSLAYPAAVTEDLPAWAAIKRSCRLTRGVRGWIFLATAVICAISYAAFLVVELLLLVVVLVGALAAHALPLPQFLAFVGLGVVGLILLVALYLFIALTMAAYSTVFAVYYHEQRRREEAMAELVQAALPTA